MEKFKVLLLLLLSFFTVSGIAQNKAIASPSGTVIFNCKITVTDEALLSQSKKDYMKAFLKSLKETVIVEQRFAGIKVDTVKINNSLKANEASLTLLTNHMIIEDDNVRFCAKYQDSILKKYQIKNGIDETAVINGKTRKLANGYNEDFFEFSENEIKDVKEYRDSITTIHGYRCFKVVYTFSEPDLSEFSTLMSSYTNTRELWVTDRIKSAFHPIVNDREIITQYYPLEILEYSDMIKGIRKKYTLESIDIK